MKKFYSFMLAALAALTMSVSMSSCGDDEDPIVPPTPDPTPDPSMVVSASLILGEDQYALNSHSAISLDGAEALLVNVENNPKVIGATYLVNELVMGQDEEGTFWHVGKELAAGEMSMNGFAYAEFEDYLAFYYGKKYQVSVTLFENPVDPTEIGTYTFEINGSAEPLADMEVTTSLLYGENEYTLSSHSTISIEIAEALKVNVENNPKICGITYLVNEMKMGQDEEGNIFWHVGQELAAGEMSMNSIAYSEFEAPITFFQGKKYQIAVTLFENAQEPEELETYVYEVNGATVVEE